MLFIIIGIIVAVISMGFLYDASEEWLPWFFPGLGFGFAFGLLAYVIVILPLDLNLSYDVLPAEICELKEFQDNRYYERSTSGDSVSVFVIQPDGSYVKETYEEDKVVFLDGEKAQVSIVKEKAAWSENDKFWFFYEPTEKEKIQSVTITVPRDSYEANEAWQNMVHNVDSDGKEITEFSKYCTGCGTEVKEEWAFCSGCGQKIRE